MERRTMWGGPISAINLIAPASMTVTQSLNALRNLYTLPFH